MKTIGTDSSPARYFPEERNHMIVLGKRLVVKPDPKSLTTDGGIILPESHSQRDFASGTVVAVGAEIGLRSIIGKKVWFRQGSELPNGLALVEEAAVGYVENEEEHHDD